MDFTYTKTVLNRLLYEVLCDYTAEDLKEEIEFELEKIKMLEKKVIPVELPVILPKASPQNEQIDVWRIEAKGIGSAYYEHDISIVEDMLKSCDYDDGYIITKHQMDKKQYESLPEFQGF